MPYRLWETFASCLLCIVLVATCSAQQPGSDGGDSTMATTQGQNPHSVFSRLLSNRQQVVASVAAASAATDAISTTAHRNVTIAIPSYVETGRVGDAIQQTGGTSDIYPMVTQVPQRDPRLEQATQPTRRSRKIPTYAQLMAARAAGHFDHDETIKRERPLSMNVIERPPQPEPFYEARAQESGNDALKDALEKALQGTAPDIKDPETVPTEQPRVVPAEPPTAPAVPETKPSTPARDPAPSLFDDLPDAQELLDTKRKRPVAPETTTPQLPKPESDAESDLERTLRELLRQPNEKQPTPDEQPMPELPVPDEQPLPDVEPVPDVQPLPDAEAVPDVEPVPDEPPVQPKPPVEKPKSRLQLEFPGLLDDEPGDLEADLGANAGDTDTGDTDIDEMLNDDMPGGELAEEDDDFLVEPPVVSRTRRRGPTNYPTTLSQVFDAEDQIDPMVEQGFCNDVWNCAGGRCQSWWSRARRDFCRTQEVQSQGCSNQRNFLGQMICSNCGVLGGNCGCGAGFLSGGGGCGMGIAGVFRPGLGGGGLSSCSSSECTSCSGVGCDRCHSDNFETWHLWPKLIGQSNPRFMIGGWTAAGYHNAANGLFNDHPDRFNIGQQWLYAQRQARPTAQRWDWGFRADVVYGVDAQDTQAFGNNPGRFDYLNGLDYGIYGLAIPQAYGEIAGENMSVIVGHFFTLIGYETVTAPNNFFYSHSITFYNSEPFTHTGVLATYSGLADSELYIGWTLGWDTGFDQFDGGSNFLGGFSTSLTDKLNFTYIATAGDFGARGDGYSHSLLFDTAISEKWNYVVQSDLLRTARGEDNVGVNQYLFWNMNNCLALGARMEWWKGDNVTSYVPFNSTAPTSGSFSSYEATVGANIRPGTTNLVFRPEVRFDWSPALDYNEQTFGIDMILTY